jgi:hypothetical protein
VGRRNLLVLAAVAAASVVACGGDDGDTTCGTGGESGGGVATVHTAPPLEPVVSELVDAYNETSDADIELAVAPQDEVVHAVSGCEPAVVPAAWLGGVDTESVVIGRNLAIIAVPAGNPSQVTGVDAFARDSVLETAICGAESPVGNFATLVLGRGGVRPDPARVGEGCDADVVARVASGQLDAALLFRGNVPIPEGVEVVNLPDDQNLVIDIRYAPAADDASTDSFQGFLASDAAQQLLTQQGYLP